MTHSVVGILADMARRLGPSSPCPQSIKPMLDATKLVKVQCPMRKKSYPMRLQKLLVPLIDTGD